MHCQTETPVPLKDSTESAKHNFMDFPELTATKKAHQQQPQQQDASEKKVHAIVAHENDILLGRGGKNNMHVGNEKLRERARKVADQYHRSSKKEKSYLSRTLVQQVKEMDPPGRFLRRNTKENHWDDMTDDEDKCREKCAQVLRDAVAYVGLKDPPPPSMAQREEQLLNNTFSMRRANPMMNVHHLQQQQQAMQQIQQMNPFAMSATSSSQIMNHHHQQQLALASGRADMAAARQFSFPNYHNSPAARHHSLAPTNGFDPLALPAAAATGYASLPQNNIPQSIQMGGGFQQGDGSFRAPKRRRMSNPFSNPFFDPFAGLPSDAAAVTAAFGGPSGFDRRLSIASNSYPVGSDFPHANPGRVRRDSIFGNLSLGAHGSDHSAPSMRDFELFPDITETSGECAEGAPKNDNDNDEFSSDFC